MRYRRRSDPSAGFKLSFVRAVVCPIAGGLIRQGRAFSSSLTRVLHLCQAGLKWRQQEPNSLSRRLSHGANFCREISCPYSHPFR